jgi:gluconate 2-dehydrogenase gamma chain
LYWWFLYLFKKQHSKTEADMNRRKSIKALLIGGAATGLVVDACNTPANKPVVANAEANEKWNDRMAEEIAHEKQLEANQFFTPAEMATITILADIIIPKDAISGSASEAKVPDFIEFIVKDMPQHQTPMRGGLRWLDVESLKRFAKPFTSITATDQLKIIDDIAYPNKVKPGMEQGVAFFSLMRDLTASGFYTSAIGVKDIGYAGNVPNQWNGVPADVLAQYKLAYTEKELKECVSFG